MRHALLVLALLACNKPVSPPEPPPATQIVPSTADALVGHWRGALDLGAARLTLVLHVEQGPDGLTATMDSPDQGARGIPVSEVNVDGSAVAFVIPSIAGRFTATLVDDALKGDWTQGPQSFPLVLERTDDTGPQRRPQDPVEPFPYTVEEVKIPSVDGVVLAGTFTRPAGDGPFPAVVLITGSGAQNRDEALMGHRPFAVLADHLTRAGIAVIHTDDRGVAASTGDFATATTPDFALDTAAVLGWLQARADTAGTGLIGHSEGGLVAPLVQVGTGPRADFLVLLAGPAVKGAAILEEQGVLIGRAQGISEADLVLQRQQNRTAIEGSVRGDDAGTIVAAMLALPGVEASSEAELREAIAPLTSPWFRWFLAFDPTQTLSAVEVPVLALFGELDLQVPAAQNAEAMRKSLGKHGTVEVLPGLNHLFQPASTGSPSEYASIETTMDPVVLDRIAAWVLAR